MRHLLFIAAAFAAAPALGAETPWQNVADGVRLRLIASDMLRPDGTTLAALEVDMSPALHTYWRVPGESGIPTTLDTAGSTGVNAAEVQWPYPEIDEEEGVTDFVYHGSTVLPVELKLDGTSATLKAAVVMGVCSDICVPVKADFELPLDFAAADHSQSLRIAQAMSNVPLPWDGDAGAIGEASFDVANATLTIPVSDPAIDPATIIADANPTGQLFGAPQKSPDGHAALLPLLGGSGAAELAGRQVQLSFMTDRGAYTVTRTISLSGSTGANP